VCCVFRLFFRAFIIRRNHLFQQEDLSKGILHTPVGRRCTRGNSHDNVLVRIRLEGRQEFFGDNFPVDGPMCDGVVGPYTIRPVDVERPNAGVVGDF
jgi:hypothetical protein